MISFIARSSGTAQLAALRQTVPSGIVPPALGYNTTEKILVENLTQTHTNFGAGKYLPEANGLWSSGPKVSRSLSGTSQRRYAHTDIKFPDFSEYRYQVVKDGTVASAESEHMRKNYTYILMATAGAIAMYSGKNVVRAAIGNLGAAANVLAMGQLEVKLADIPEGKGATFKWREKPLFIRHRTTEEIEKEQAVDPSILRDPQHDNDRVQKPEWLVVLGICTHLGCVPLVGLGDYGGYYCPCHGSHYDASGRIRKGPAPLNLEVPQYSFPDDETLVVG